jgi:hypothetical protein
MKAILTKCSSPSDEWELIEVSTLEDLLQIMKDHNNEDLIVGEWNNVLFVKVYDGYNE